MEPGPATDKRARLARRAGVSDNVRKTPAWDELRACRPSEGLTLASSSEATARVCGTRRLNVVRGERLRFDHQHARSHAEGASRDSSGGPCSYAWWLLRKGLAPCRREGRRATPSFQRQRTAAHLARGWASASGSVWCQGPEWLAIPYRARSQVPQRLVDPARRWARAIRPARVRRERRRVGR